MQKNTGMKYRYIWSELEEIDHEAGEPSMQPVARDYSTGNYEAFHFGDMALVLVEMTAHQIESASQDHRLVVLPSVHSGKPVANSVIDYINNHSDEWDLERGMNMYDFLSKLGEREHRFIPEQ